MDFVLYLSPYDETILRTTDPIFFYISFFWAARIITIQHVLKYRTQSPQEGEAIPEWPEWPTQSPTIKEWERKFKNACAFPLPRIDSFFLRPSDIMPLLPIYFRFVAIFSKVRLQLHRC